MLYAIIFLMLVGLELGYFALANRFDIIDRPNERSSHTKVTLRGGGIVFLFGAWVYGAVFGLEYGWFLLGLTLIGMISFVDDIHSLPDSVRLVVQFVAMFLMFYQFGILELRYWWIILVAIIVCVGIINAYNFMDGINGITGGYSLAVLLPLIYLNEDMAFVSMPLLYIIGLSLVVFCIFNFRRRAKCFAGDVGSITIAFILLFTLGELILQTGDFAYIVFLAVYGADSILTICHRIRLHENLGAAHRKHAYQIMANELRIPHVSVSLLYMTIQLVISFGMIFLPVNHYVFLGVTVVVLMLGYIIFMKRYYHLHEAYLRSTNGKH